jgi:thioredoxin-related protein
MKGSILLLIAGSFLLGSCADLLKVPTVKAKKIKSKKITTDQSGGGALSGNPMVKTGQPNEDVAVGKAPEEAGYLPARVGEGVVAGGMLLPSDDSIVWSTGRANDDIPFSDALKNKPKKKSPWISDYQEARRESMRTGKPVLLWFTRTGSPASPRCVTLNRELFSTHEFSKWAKESIVRVKIDVSGGEKEFDKYGNISATTTQKRRYAEKLKKQYHVLGYPSIIVIEPNGAVYLRERGYQRGQKSALWQKLKNAALTIEHGREVWERKMAKKGYRRWTGDNDEVVFAKLTRYQKGAVWLTEPDGNVIKTSTRNISKDDRGWIVAEMEKRGL